jgi:hypothetical protein
VKVGHRQILTKQSAPPLQVGRFALGTHMSAGSDRCGVHPYQHSRCDVVTK